LSAHDALRPYPRDHTLPERPLQMATGGTY
jgi:hypothetical protein